MAKGKIRFGKQSGGQLALVIPDGVANTEVSVPESQILATKQYADDNIAQLNVFKNYIINGNRIAVQSGKAIPEQVLTAQAREVINTLEAKLTKQDVN